jgi:hypothetical protein
LITGYNTDVEYGGIVYHIQTEDKGVEHPIILSLVYVEGAILASKRSPYDDLISGGFDKEILTQRLQRQHKLICAAVRAGRIEELKRLGDRGSQAQSPSAPNSGTETPSSRARERNKAGVEKVPVTKTDPAEDASEEVTSGLAEEALQITLLEDRELRSGESVTLQVLLTRPAKNGRKPVPRAVVALKVLGTTFSPISTNATTDRSGVALFSVSLPRFQTGRAAILIRVEVDGKTAELRRIILPE